MVEGPRKDEVSRHLKPIIKVSDRVKMPFFYPHRWTRPMRNVQSPSIHMAHRKNVANTVEFTAPLGLSRLG